MGQSMGEFDVFEKDSQCWQCSSLLLQQSPHIFEEGLFVIVVWGEYEVSQNIFSFLVVAQVVIFLKPGKQVFGRRG